MISPIASKVMENPVVKRIPYVGPVVNTVGLAMDIKDIVENGTPIGAAKTIGVRFLNECTPPEIFFAGKCVMLVGGVVATVNTGGNPIVLSGTLSAARSIVRG